MTIDVGYTLAQRTATKRFQSGCLGNGLTERAIQYFIPVFFK